MKTLNHLMDPQGSPGKHSTVHYEDPDGRHTWCKSSTRVFTVIDGERIRLWHHTKRAVTCAQCIKKMELQVRAMLPALSAEQLEDIAAHVQTFTMKYPPEGMTAPEIVTP